MIIHGSDFRGSPSQQDADCGCIMGRLEVLIDICGLKSVKLTKKTHSKAKATMLELWFCGFVIHDPIPRVLHLTDVCITRAPIFAEAKCDFQS